MKLLSVAAACVFTVARADTVREDASVEDVQGLLQEWNLKSAFGDYFQRMQIDGDMLVNDLAPTHINLDDCPQATGAHVSKLFRKIRSAAQAQAQSSTMDSSVPTAASGRSRRRLASSSGSASQSGLAILRDNAQIALGSEGDVVVSRTGDSELHLGADVAVQGTLDVSDVSSFTVNGGNATYFDATVDTTVLIGPEPIKIQQGIAVSKSFTTSADYALEFEINPYGELDNWGSILHFTTDGNCCDYGQRIPAIWFIKDSTRLNIRAGTNGTGGNAGYAPVDNLPMNQWTHVSLRVVDDTGVIKINGTTVGTIDTDLRLPHDYVKCYIADPWHQPAAAWMRNVKYQRISYHHANFYNLLDANDLEDSLDEVVAGLVSAQSDTSDVLETLETTYWDRIIDAVPDAEKNWDVFIGNQSVTAQTGAPVSGDYRTGGEYEFTMDINPYGTAGSWTNIVHFTTTGENCCGYGTRIPAIFMYANSNRLHIRSGSNSTADNQGNNGFDPLLSLPQGEWTTVRLLMTSEGGDVFYNDTYMGSIVSPIRMPHDGVEVWLGDKMHSPDPQVYLRNVKYRIVAAHHSEFYDIATDYDHSSIFNQHTA